MNTKFATALCVALSAGCNQSTTADQCNNGITADSFTNSPDPIPGSMRMSTVIGPLAVDIEKWGPDEVQPFSWPGYVVQRAPSFPQSPSDQLVYEIRLQEGALLYEAEVWVDPPKNHTKVPDSRAGAMLWTHNGGFKKNESLVSVTTLGDSVVNYEQRYLLTMQLAEPYEVKADERIFVYVFGEWGDGFLPGLGVSTPEIVSGD